MTWRPLPGHGPEREPRPIGESLERISRAMGAGRATGLASLFDRWPDIVGPSVAAHSRPLTLRDGVLTVAVDDPAWAVQLTYLEADLRREVQATLGPQTVEKVVVRIRP